MNGTAKWIQWVIGILLIVFMAISGYTANKIENISREYMTIKQYDREYSGLCGRLDRMEDKLDKLLDYQRNNKNR